MASKEKGIFSFVKGIRNEIKRITWPSKEEIKKALVAVVTICIIYIVLIAIADFIYKGLLTEILLKL